MPRSKSKGKSTTASKKAQPPPVVEKNVAPKKETKKKKPTNNYKTYIKRVLKDVSEKSQISGQTIDQLDKMAQVMARDMTSEARRICIQTEKKTISESEIKLAVNIYFPIPLADEILEKIQTSIEKSHSDNNKGDHNNPKRREISAGLIFPVALTEKFLREFGASSINVGKNAPIALTSCIENVIRRALVLSSDIASDNKKVTILPRHIYLAIQNDNNLSSLVQNFRIEFMGVGVVPYIHPEFLKKKPVKSRKKKSSKTTSHKFKPGTVATREIRRYQKSTELLLQKTPFSKVVRHITNELYQEENKIHFGAGSLIAIQTFVEQTVTRLLRETVDITIHASREGINDSDVRLAWKDVFDWVPKIEKNDIIEKIGSNGIERLGRRGGVKRTNAISYGAVREFMYSLTYLLMQRTLMFMKHRGVITVGSQDLENAIQTMRIHFTIPTYVGKAKTRKQSRTQEEIETIV